MIWSDEITNGKYYLCSLKPFVVVGCRTLEERGPCSWTCRPGWVDLRAIASPSDPRTKWRSRDRGDTEQPRCTERLTGPGNNWSKIVTNKMCQFMSQSIFKLEKIDKSKWSFYRMTNQLGSSSATPVWRELVIGCVENFFCVIRCRFHEMGT